MDAVLKIVQTVNMYLSDYILIIMLIGCGLYFSIRTKFVQVRCFGEGWRKVFGNFSLHGGKHEGGMSSFQALATAIAAQVGTGNIVGACGAILVGGPGAIFWMWIIAFFGMSTIYAEAVLAQKTRVVNPDGTVAGGPVYYIKKAFNNAFGKFMAGFFAVAIILALGFMGAMVQSNSIGESCQNAFGIPSWVMGAIIAVICAFIFIGGAHRVAAVAEKLVPIMAILYVLGGLVVIICRIQYVPETSRSSSSARSTPPQSSAARSALPSNRQSPRALSAACSPTKPVWARLLTHTLRQRSSAPTSRALLQ